jgi:hypothetical protein
LKAVPHVRFRRSLCFTPTRIGVWGQISADKRDDLFFRYLDKFIQPFVPKIVEFGIASENEMQPDTVARRIRDEVAAKDALLVWCPIVAAWARKPK